MSGANGQSSTPVRRPSLGTVALAMAAVAVSGGFLVAGIRTASYTLGWDFDAYAGAVHRLLAGQPVYQVAFTAAQREQLFQYPPTFLPLVLPFTLVPRELGLAAWLLVLVAAFGLALALLPVSARIRWLLLLVGGASWPLMFGIRIGQVGTLLLLLFAIGWRWLDRPRVVGAMTALGAAIKVQPALLGLWALLRRDRRTLLALLVVTLVIVVPVTLVVGLPTWIDFAVLLRLTSDAFAHPANRSIGAVAVQAGLSSGSASAIQLAATVGLLAVLIPTVRYATVEASYLAFVVVTQLMSPVIWDHYAIVLLLPVAWLLQRGHWWALVVPLSQLSILAGPMPPFVYLLGYLVTLASIVVLGVVERQADLRIATNLRAAASPRAL